MNDKIQPIVKNIFKKFDTPIQLGENTTTQYGVETKTFIKDIEGTEFQIKETVVIPIDKDVVLTQLDAQIAELQAQKKEITDLDK